MTEIVINEELPYNYTDYQHSIKRQQSHTESAPKRFR